MQLVISMSNNFISKIIEIGHFYERFVGKHWRLHTLTKFGRYFHRCASLFFPLFSSSFIDRLIWNTFILNGYFSVSQIVFWRWTNKPLFVQSEKNNLPRPFNRRIHDLDVDLIVFNFYFIQSTKMHSTFAKSIWRKTADLHHVA